MGLDWVPIGWYSGGVKYTVLINLPKTLLSLTGALRLDNLSQTQWYLSVVSLSGLWHLTDFEQPSDI